MAVSNTYDTTGRGSAVGNREQLDNNYYLLAPEQTPVYSMLPKKKATATFVESIVDELAAPNADGVAEGSDIDDFDNKFSGRARIGNYVHTFRRSYQVTNLQEAVDSVGPVNFAQAEAKAIREIKRDIEMAICSNNDRSAEDGAGTNYKLRGLGNWLNSDGPSDVPAAYRTPADSIITDGSALTETQFLNMLTSIYRVTGSTNNLTLVADTTLRRSISDYQRLGDQTNTIRNVNYVGGSTSINVSVEMYQSDHGMVSIINANPDCMPETTEKGWQGYLLNPEYLCWDELIPMGSTRLENQGGGPRGYVDYVGTLSMKHPGAHGKITD